MCQGLEVFPLIMPSIGSSYSFQIQGFSNADTPLLVSSDQPEICTLNRFQTGTLELIQRLKSLMFKVQLDFLGVWNK